MFSTFYGFIILRLSRKSKKKQKARPLEMEISSRLWFADSHPLDLVSGKPVYRWTHEQILKWAKHIYFYLFENVEQNYHKARTYPIFDGPIGVGSIFRHLHSWFTSQCAPFILVLYLKFRFLIGLTVFQEQKIYENSSVTTVQHVDPIEKKYPQLIFFGNLLSLN